MAKTKSAKTNKKVAPKKDAAKKEAPKKAASKSKDVPKLKPMAAKAANTAKGAKTAPMKSVGDQKKGDAGKPETTQKKASGKAPGDSLSEKSTAGKPMSAKTVGKGKGRAKKVENKEDDFDADIDSYGFGDSEIAEYEEDLKAVEEIDDIEIADVETDDDVDERDQEVYLTDSEGRRLCRVRDCDQVATVEGYCRYHYLLLWKRIQIRKSILQDGKLEKYILDLTSRYPDKYLEAIKKDLRTEKDFLSAVQELEIDESAIGEIESGQDEEVQSFADEFRGIGETPSMDDDGDY